MNLRLPKLYSLSLLFSVALGGFYILMPEVAKELELVFFIGIMLSIGIPHGATDHIVYQFESGQEQPNRSWWFFLATYLGAMLLYSLCWFFFPMLSLLIFLIISAFHFGQSQLLFVSWKELNPLKVLLYVSWGFLILLGIIGFHLQDSLEILSSLFAKDLLISQETVTIALLTSGGIYLLVMLFALAKGKMSGVAFFFELLNTFLLLGISYFTSLMFSFALYFGFWHSLASISHEVEIIRQDRPGFGWKAFFREAIPFSVISFVGIGILLFAGQWLNALMSPYLLFFIAISTLTLPHMIFMQKLYNGVKSRPKQSALA
ncbi:MAG: Brp/Blh family beta-carotene 15,15'-dioxygenase [Bacteroidia bacterium]|nr:Brp/Blh family beta-carotene 15,15'-dioxygenase [Bacteroidia bacterium]